MYNLDEKKIVSKSINKGLWIIITFLSGPSLIGQSFPSQGFILPAGKTICITYEVDVDGCPAGDAPANISNQASVSGTNFAMVPTDDPDAGGTSDPTITPYTGFVVGNLIFEDVNGNGVFDMGDSGINDVVVNLYVDMNTNNVLDIGDGALIATTTTTTVMAQTGLYSFTVCPGTYIIEIAPSNFSMGGALYNSGSPYISNPTGVAPDPDVNTADNDDNGNDPVNPFGVASSAFVVSANKLDVDFSFIKGTSVSINDVTLTEGSAGSSKSFDFTVSRSKNNEAFILTVNTLGVSATSGTDFTAISGGTVSFLAGGDLMATISVQVAQDAIVEDDETFTVVLSGAPSGIILTDDTGLGTITNDDDATLTLSGGTAKDEGDASLMAYTFTASLNADVQGGFEVSYTTEDGTATAADGDYSDNDNTLSFAGTSGEMQNITVNVNGDAKVELDEDFTVSLGAISMTSAIQLAAISKIGTPQTGTITNDDAAIVTLAENISQLESMSPQVFGVSLSNPVDMDVTLNFSTGDDAAMTGDMDYIAITNQLVTFTAGTTTTQMVNVSVADDSKVEADEVFNVILSSLNAGGRAVTFQGTGVTFSGTGTIENDDAATVTLSGGGSIAEGSSGTTSAVFTATLNNHVQGGFALAYTTNDGTATNADLDYVDNDNSLTFTGTVNEMQQITVLVNGDHKVEANETFEVALGGFSGTSLTASLSTASSPQITTITNDEIDFGDAPDPTYPTLLASNGARHSTLFGFQLGNAIDGEDDGQPNALSTGDGTDEDGVILPTLITGVTANIDVNASMSGVLNAWVDFNRDGDFADADEQIFTDQVLIAGNNALSVPVPGGATMGTSFARFRLTTATGTGYDGAATDGEVEDYQVQIANTQFSVNDPVAIAEGNSGTTILTFTVTRSNNANNCSVDFGITGGSATIADNDFTVMTASPLNFNAGGSASASIIILVNGDNKVELNETVELTLSNPINASILDGFGQSTINNDDQGTITVTNPGISEGDSGQKMMAFQVNLNNPSDADVSLDYTTMNGNAEDQNGTADYQSTSGSLTFTSGQVSKTVNMLINGDCTIEMDESFSLKLSNLTASSRNIIFTGATSMLSGTGTILNDDAAPLLNCPADVFKLLACGATNISVTLPLPSPSSICQMSVLEFRHRTVSSSNVPTGSFSTYFAATANIKSFTIGRYEIQWRVSDGSGSSNCSYYLQVNEIKPVVPQISGPVTICSNINNIPYSVAPQPGIVTYQWSYSGTNVTIHNNGSTNVTLDFNAGATGGQLNVVAVHPCGGTNAVGNSNIQVGSLLACSLVNCLISDLFVGDNTLTVPGMPQIFKVSDNISSNATLLSPKTFLFKAGNSINLLSGFKVNSGAVFVAEIEDCPLIFPFLQNK